MWNIYLKHYTVHLSLIFKHKGYFTFTRYLKSESANILLTIHLSMFISLSLENWLYQWSSLCNKPLAYPYLDHLSLKGLEICDSIHQSDASFVLWWTGTQSSDLKLAVDSSDRRQMKDSVSTLGHYPVVRWSWILCHVFYYSYKDIVLKTLPVNSWYRS